jgi:hypothetical protein
MLAEYRKTKVPFPTLSTAGARPIGVPTGCGEGRLVRSRTDSGAADRIAENHADAANKPNSLNIVT